MHLSTVVFLGFILAVSAQKTCKDLPATELLEAVVGDRATITDKEVTTVFIPTAEALKAYVDDQFDGKIQNLAKDADAVLKLVDMHRVLGKAYTMKQLRKQKSVEPKLAEEESPCSVKIKYKKGTIVLEGPNNSVKIVKKQSDQKICKSVVHVIDGVLRPCGSDVPEDR
ncbi:hypothetical protein BSKO_03549 [Bryopsis sp. KO-2023]|nr:hypothetical protein BSKO_03549 [Bryopsis sp. KO-2023]